MWQVPARFVNALGGAHRVAVRVEVWAGGERLVSDAPWLTGSSTDKWVTGIRRTLSMSVPPTKGWLSWLGTPGLEVRPFVGLRFGAGDDGTVLCPMGRFAVSTTSTTLDADQPIPISGSDGWSRVVGNTFPYPTPSYQGSIGDVAARLIMESTQRDPSTYVALSVNAPLAPVLWERSRHDAIADLMDSVGGVAYLDRVGRGYVKDREPRGDPVVTLRTGTGGTVIDLSSDIDLGSVRNAVVASSTDADSPYRPVEVKITEYNDPAHWRRIGWQREILRSAQLGNELQAYAAAKALLDKLSAPARTLSVEMVPNYALDAGDTVRVVWPDGRTQDAQISEINHPFDVGSTQKAKLVSVMTGVG